MLRWIGLICMCLLGQYVQRTQTKASILFQDLTLAGGGHFAKFQARENNEGSEYRGQQRRNGDQNPSGSVASDASNTRSNGKATTEISSSSRNKEYDNSTSKPNGTNASASRFRNLRRLIEELTDEGENEDEDDDVDEYAEYGSWGNFPSRAGQSNRYIHGSTGESIDPQEYERVFNRVKAKQGPDVFTTAIESEITSTDLPIESDQQDLKLPKESPKLHQEYDHNSIQRIDTDSSKDGQSERQLERVDQYLGSSPTSHVSSLDTKTSQVNDEKAISRLPSINQSPNVVIGATVKVSTFLPNNKSLMKISALAASISILTFASVKPLTLPLTLFQQQFIERIFVVLSSFAPSFIVLVVALFVSPKPAFDVNIFVNQVFTSFFLMYPFLLMAEVLLTTGMLVMCLRFFAPNIFDEHRDIPGILLPWLVPLHPKLYMIAKVLIEGCLLPWLHVAVIQKSIRQGKLVKSSGEEKRLSFTEIYGLACGLKFAKLTLQIARSFHVWGSLSSQPTGVVGWNAGLQGFANGLFPINELITLLVYKSTLAATAKGSYLGFAHAFIILAFSSFRGSWKPLYSSFASTQQPTTFSPSMLWKSFGSLGILMQYGMDLLYKLLILQALVKVIRFSWKQGQGDNAVAEHKIV